MIYWAPFLHMYQPPTQLHGVLKKVCDESYRPLFKMLLEHPNAKVTVNICGVLTEMLRDHGHQDVIENIKELAKEEKLEFVESAKYHPILPLIPPKEIRRQINLNNQTNEYFFGKFYKPRGFFSPEMCYSNEMAIILSAMGYKWLLISGVACVAPWPLDVIYKAPLGKNDIIIFYRDDIVSNKISFHNLDSKEFINELIALSKGKKDIYVITAMDAETFGHHIQNWEKLFLAEVYKTIEDYTSEDVDIDVKQKTDLAETHRDILSAKSAAQVRVVTISELLDKFPIKRSKQPLSSSWSTTKDSIQKDNYYPLWQDNSNPVHKLQWQHLDICFDLVDIAMGLKDNKESRRFAAISRALLDRAVHSCQFWWANRAGMWNINIVNKGLICHEEVIFNAYKAIYISKQREDIKKEANYKLLASREIAHQLRDHLIED